jgi:hypothetical protein
VSAVLSACGRYRYRLARPVEGAVDPRVDGRVLWVMLNPSTADAVKNDNTIRRCTAFTRSWGYSGFMVGNLYALRSSDPAALWEADDPVGPQNLEHLRDMASEASLIIAAWGAHAERGQSDAIAGLLCAHGPVWCLGMSRRGMPRHPLMLPADTARVLFLPGPRLP